jgi:hypothetical protein
VTRSKSRRCEYKGCRKLTMQPLCDAHRDKPDNATLIEKADARYRAIQIERLRAALAALKVAPGDPPRDESPDFVPRNFETWGDLNQT